MTSNLPIGRRGLVAGLGLAGAAAVLAPTARADATPGGATGPGPGRAGKLRNAAPAGLHPIASAPLTGYTYTFLDMWDFSPENYVSGRAWTSRGGTYAPVGSGDTLWATTQIPPGAVLGDVEWYVQSTSETQLMGRIWVSGTPTLMRQVCDGSISANAQIGLVRARRVVPTGGTDGPYPHGTKLALGVFTPNDASVAVNGARVGWKLAPAGDVILRSPIRVYDSRSSTKIVTGHTRTHDLATRLPVAATGAILTVTVLNTEHVGYLKVYSSTVSAPAASAIGWYGTGQRFSSAVQTAVSSGRSFKVTCGGTGSRTDYVLDLVGYTV